VTAAARLLDPAILARIGDLELLARTVVDGFIAGLHESPYLGVSTDFAEHRPYLPGDDVRRVDWRLWGRTDRFYVKEFEADTNANLVVLLDTSRSMSFGSGSVTKLDYGKFLAASLLYLSRRQRDRVGLVTFDSELREVVPPSARHLERALHALERSGPGGAAGTMQEPLARAGAILRRRSIWVIISDCYEPPDEVVRSIGALRGRGSDLILFHVVDPQERDFAFTEPAPFEDLETGDRLPVIPSGQADRYRALFADHCRALETRLVQSGVDFATAPTDRPLDEALFFYLSRRRAMTRTR
jgi:uncharacterized protein (DUF58 family)